MTAISRMKADGAVGIRRANVGECIEQALYESIYPTLLEVVRQPPCDGPSPRWAIAVIASIMKPEEAIDTLLELAVRMEARAGRAKHES